MERPNIYCSFCGVVILADNFEEPPSLEVRRPWYSEARAIRMRHGASDDISLTGVGILRSRSVLHVPVEVDSTYQNTENLEPVMLSQNLGDSWGFGFHDACWGLFLLRLGVVKDEIDNVLQCLFIQFLNSPWPGFSSLDFGHDYGGAANTHKSWGLPRPVDLTSPLYADPNAIPSFDMVELKTPPSLLLRIAHQTDITGESRPQSASPAFGNLSLELVYEIFSYLPCSQLAKLRLVCRDLSWKARPDQLPQSYWKSRFYLGQELGFMCPNSSMVARDWFRAYWGTTSFLVAGELSLVNRKRIWSLLEPIAMLVESHLPLPLAKAGYIVPLPDKDEQECYTYSAADAHADVSGDIYLMQSFSGQISPKKERGPLENGCDMLELRAVHFAPCGHQEGLQITISGLRLGTRVVLSGLSFDCRENMQVDESRLGICDTPMQWTIDVPSKSSIKSIKVAFCSLGLVGVKFIYRNGRSSTWVGQSQGDGVAYGTLNIPPDARECFLLAGLDDIKIVKLGMATSMETVGSGPLMNHLLSMKDRHDISIDSRLWTPDIPEHEDVKVTRLVPGSREGTFEPLVNIDFGGANGLLLESLSRVVMHMLSDIHPITRMEFHYIDGTVKAFGAGPFAAELSFCVDGPGRERITKVGILQNPVKLTFAGIQLVTNRGRTAHFASLRQQTRTEDVHYLPLHLGDVVTGLVGSIEESKRTFSKIGIQSQPGKEKHSSAIEHANYESFEPWEGVVKYDLEFAEPIIRTKGVSEYSTHASLQNVKSIRASIGLSGRSRAPDRISGLRFEFHHQQNASILGQWMEGSHEFTVDIASDESIQCVTVWITKDAMSGEYFGMYQGQVAAIRISTDHGQNLTFCPSADLNVLNTCLKTQYQATPYQELFEVEPRTDKEFIESRRLKFAVSEITDEETYCDRGVLSLWAKHKPSADRMANAAQARHIFYPPVGTRLAGIYVSCQKFAYLGCLYEPEA
ncbi:hypothetical protein P170DRAFT_460202 [Aspergillus steynii IBT 23096]|uniref:Uncharacterized protein n=1 Tax=Aspergillus steynii IBT 23096 TaxID=1392250 RepID=A0A2I2GLY5_9EURO|nr:uncharacterized protein P170DRAFT_460202 [Aspergillus steynii IBT 23096]PLB53887.1 hypothetical protein P170DRAFT_460202 [Aspergillus steynii IBT 23096]